MSNRIELTPKLKAFISGIGIAVCGLLAFLAGDLLTNSAAKHAGTIVFCLGVFISSATWILGLKK